MHASKKKLYEQDVGIWEIRAGQKMPRAKEKKFYQLNDRITHVDLFNCITAFSS